ncbi:LysR family transcriptional regulator [Pseudomonas aeruginosa]|uniref:LysR family transcriptional regulator n=1 Tax=Pseudomonas aeruginosa TaxID=287 RepID=UPI000F8387DB|nr:LysR family transcriptional regulator [Pseudomonas aeruginosa]MBI7468845.1 LysR family transcriptional regulator [Pseudomonas aeruginosa]RTW22440.1 LysR family transcriptional regulator [Pseudomonas aeruginosa]
MLDDLNIFVKTVQSGSMSSAGRRMGIPQNSISRRMKALEEKLGVKLLIRDARKQKCTKLGSHLYEGCHEALDCIFKTIEWIKLSTRDSSERVKMQAPSLVAREVSLLIIHSLSLNPPPIEVDISESDFESTHGDVDLFFTLGEPDHLLYTSKKLFEIDFGLYASKEYYASHACSEIKSPYDLSSHEIISSANNKTIHLISLKDQKTHGILSGTRFSSSSEQGLLAAAESGAGIVLVNCKFAESNGLKRILPQFPPRNKAVYIAYKNTSSLSAAAKTILQLIISTHEKTWRIA